MPLDLLVPDLPPSPDAPDALRAVRMPALEKWLARADCERNPGRGATRTLASLFRDLQDRRVVQPQVVVIDPQVHGIRPNPCHPGGARGLILPCEHTVPARALVPRAQADR